MTLVRWSGEGLRWPPVCGGREGRGLVSLAAPTVIVVVDVECGE